MTATNKDLRIVSREEYAKLRAEGRLEADKVYAIYAEDGTNAANTGIVELWCSPADGITPDRSTLPDWLDYHFGTESVVEMHGGTAGLWHWDLAKVPQNSHLYMVSAALISKDRFVTVHREDFGPITGSGSNPRRQSGNTALPYVEIQVGDRPVYMPIKFKSAKKFRRKLLNLVGWAAAVMSEENQG